MLNLYSSFTLSNLNNSKFDGLTNLKLFEITIYDIRCIDRYSLTIITLDMSVVTVPSKCYTYFSLHSSRNFSLHTSGSE